MAVQAIARQTRQQESEAQRWQRALDRALAEALDVFTEPISGATFVESATHPGTLYAVTVDSAPARRGARHPLQASRGAHGAARHAAAGRWADTGPHRPDGPASAPVLVDARPVTAAASSTPARAGGAASSAPARAGWRSTVRPGTGPPLATFPAQPWQSRPNGLTHRG